MAPRLVEFDIDEAVEFILNDSISLSKRAIKLYELQLALITCQRPPPSKKGAGGRRGPLPRRGNHFTLWVKSGYLACARTYACMQLLEHLEFAKNGQPEVSEALTTRARGRKDRRKMGPFSSLARNQLLTRAL
jgi:hypothetical protein